MTLHNIKLVIEYEGTRYHGWQRQPEVITVQKVLEESLSRLFNEPIKTQAAGRTDAGVHAKAQVVNFKTHLYLPRRAIICGLNTYLPEDIRVRSAKEVSLDFHAQRSALNRTYRYVIYNYRFCPPFYRNFVWKVSFSLEIGLIREGSKFLIGEYDFSSFQAQGSFTSSPRRKIEKISFLKKGRFIFIYIKANSFLYKMARNIVGTLVEVGRGKIAPFRIKQILEAKNRKCAGPTAPPQGLYLVWVSYSR